ncbi:MAG: RIP metalloprotease RseP [Saprospiraceae bacterium]|nr:RIP metalloprotease RseP [Saprospiraceae bacterium]
MDILSLALQLILSLSILVVLHEAGHFFPAIWFKTRVEKFYLFFDPWFSLFKIKRGDTEYGIGWIPFGGYVKISGMIDESMDKEQMKQPPQPWEFRSKKAWQRLIIMVGGVTVNFILGFLIFGFILFYWGETYTKNADVTYGIAVDSMGMKLGLQDGDKIISVGGVKMEKFNPGFVVKEIILHDAKEISVEREGSIINLPVDPSITGELTKYENKNKKLFYTRVPLGVDEVTKGGNADKAGMQDKDKIISVNGNPVNYFHELTRNLQALKSQTATFLVVRNEQDTLSLQIPVTESGTVGFKPTPPDKFFTISREKYSFLQAMPKGVTMGVNFLTDQIKAFGQIFSGKIKAKDSLGSIFSMASMFDTGWDWEVFWRMTGMLSILLAFFNLLPIPALDGGYVIFLLWEMITGKAPSDRFMEIVNIIGFILLMTLMVFALGLDISRWF